MATFIHIAKPDKPVSKGDRPYYALSARHVPTVEYVDPHRARAGLASSDPDLIVSIHAAALNHRDLFIRQHLYPAISFDVAMLADGAGVVSEVIPTSASPSSPSPLSPSSSTTPTVGQRVLINPGHNWHSRPSGPEYFPSGPYTITGGTRASPFHGTLSTSIRVPASSVVPAPAHLTAAQAASLPLAGLTAWRAVVTKLRDLEVEAEEEAEAEASQSGSNRNDGDAKLRIVITGIGGGVAVFALQFATARGHDVWVTSSSQSKIDRAVSLGASGGELYTSPGWEGRLLDSLTSSSSSPPSGRFDAIIDSAGGPTFTKSAVALLRPGGVVVQYGLTVPPHSVTYGMPAILSNIEFRGSTMGSAREFRDMVSFVGKTKLVPVVDSVVDVVDNGTDKGTDVGEALEKAIPRIDALFDRMRAVGQFGKLVVQIRDRSEWKSDEAKQAHHRL